MPKRKEENNLNATNEVDKTASQSRPKIKKKKEESPEPQKSPRDLDYEYLEQAGKRITRAARKYKKQSDKKLSYNQAIALSALKG